MSQGFAKQSASAATGISGISAGTQMQTSGTVILSNSNSISFGLNAGTLTATVAYPVQSVQPGITALGVSGGNTAGNTGTTQGTVFLQGGNNITLSQITAAGSLATVIVSAFNQSAQAAQTGISSIAASDTTYTSGQVQFTGSNMVTVKSAAGQKVVIDATQTVQTQNLVDLSLSTAAGGATSGTMALVSSGTLTLYAGNNITLSQSGTNNITISGANTVAQTIQTQGITGDQVSLGVSTGGNTSGNTTVATGTRFVLVGSNGITLSQSTAAGAATVTISGITQTNQSAIKALGVSNTGNTAGNTGVSTGIDWVLAGSNNITVSQSTAGGGPNTVWISGPTVGGAQTGISGLANSQTTYTSGTVSLSELGAITIRSTTGNQYQFSVNSQTNQSIGLYASSNTYLTSSGTQDARSLSFRGDKSITVGISAGEVLFSVGAYLTTAMQSNAATLSNVNLSAGTTSNNLSNFVLSNSNGVSFGLSGSTVTATVKTDYLTTAMLSNAATISNVNLSAGTTSQNLSAMVFSNSNNVSFGLSGSTITATVTVAGGAAATTISGVTSANVLGTNVARFAVEDHQHAGVMSAGVSNLGNTTGNTAVLPGQLVLAGANGITLSQSTSNNNAMTVTISGPVQTLSFYQNCDYLFGGQPSNVNMAGSTRSLWIQPLTPSDFFPGVMTASSIYFRWSGNSTTSGGSLSNNARSFQFTFSLGLYTLNNGTAFSLLNSASTLISASSVTQTASSSNGNTSLFQGIRHVLFVSSAWSAAPVFSCDKSYYIGFWYDVAGAPIACNLLHVLAGGGFINSGPFGGASASNVSQLNGLLGGRYSANFASAMPASVHVSALNRLSSNLVMPHLQFVNYSQFTY